MYLNDQHARSCELFSKQNQVPIIMFAMHDHTYLCYYIHSLHEHVLTHIWYVYIINTIDSLHKCVYMLHKNICNVHSSQDAFASPRTTTYTLSLETLELFCGISLLNDSSVKCFMCYAFKDTLLINDKNEQQEAL